MLDGEGGGLRVAALFAGKVPKSLQERRMRRAKEQAGFTLIELLIVVVIIGILASIAIPKFASTKEKAFLAAMKSDLRNLVTAQEGYLGDNQVYYGGGIPNAAFEYRPTTGITVA